MAAGEGNRSLTRCLARFVRNRRKYSYRNIILPLPLFGNAKSCPFLAKLFCHTESYVRVGLLDCRPVVKPRPIG